MKNPILYAMLFATANASAMQPAPNERRGPPQEFFDACKGKAEGASVSARGPRGEDMRGTCRMVMVPTAPMAEPKKK